MVRKSSTVAKILSLLVSFLFLWGTGFSEGIEGEKAAVTKVIDQSISWFQNKDFPLLFRVFSDSPALFLFQPTSTTTILGGEAFRKYAEGWKNPDLVYDHHAIRDLRIDFSPHGDTAWFSAIAEDCSRYKEKLGCWKDVRWTGVLLKQGDRWVVMQMHFSFAADKVLAEERAKRETEKRETTKKP